MKKTFDEVVLFARTGLNPRQNFKLGQGKNKYITIKNIKNNTLAVDDNTDVVDDDAIKLIHKRSQIKKGDILFASIGRMGDMYIIEKEPVGWDINESVFAFTLNTNIVRQKYFYYIFKVKSTLDYLASNSSGSTFKSIKMNQLKRMVFDIPSLKEQDSIITILDKVCNVIEMRKRELGSLDELIKARFVEMFGDPYVNPLKWKMLKIKDAVTIEPQNGLYKPQSDYVTDGSGTPILRIDGFYNGRVTDFGSLKRLKCSGIEQQRYLLLEDDIVINRVNSIEYLGKCAHIKGLLEDTVYESNMMRMHFDPEYYNPVYICQLLCSQYIYDQIVNHAKKAVNQASINQKDVLDFNIYQPPLDLQNEFADFVNQVDKSKVTKQIDSHIS